MIDTKTAHWRFFEFADGRMSTDYPHPEFVWFRRSFKLKDNFFARSGNAGRRLIPVENLDKSRGGKTIQRDRDPKLSAYAEHELDPAHNFPRSGKSLDYKIGNPEFFRAILVFGNTPMRRNYNGNFCKPGIGAHFFYEFKPAHPRFAKNS